MHVIAVSAALLVAAAGAPPGAPGLREDEGTVVVARGHPILLATGGGPVLVSPVPGAEISGIRALKELAPGDRVRYAWHTERAGVRLAERLAADPPLFFDPALAVTPGLLEQELAAAKVTVVDARPRAEWEAGHLPGAVSVPYDAPVGELERMPPGPVVVHGASERTPEGHRLLRRLLARKREGVRVLAGGARAWEADGRPLEIELPAIRRALSGGGHLLVVDVRPREASSALPLPGTLALPVEELAPGEVASPAQLPTIVLIGGGGQDAGASAALVRIARWRRATDFPQWTLRVLAGGAEAWRKAGLSPELRASRAPLRWEAPAAAGQIGVDAFGALLGSNGGEAVLLDVRPPRPSPPGVLNVPLEELASRLGELPRDRELVVFCAAGYRSQVARELLVRNGFKARFLWAVPPP